MCNKEAGTDIERELSLIQQRWKEIKEQVKRARSKIKLTIQLYTLVQEVFIKTLFIYYSLHNSYFIFVNYLRKI